MIIWRKARRVVLYVIISLPSIAVAQISEGALGYFDDVARFSYTQIGGTSRALGMGGTQTALGADVTAANVNPAGLGLYNRSEITFSPSMQFINSTTAYENPNVSKTSKNNRTNFNIGNFGIVFSGISPEDNDKKNKGGVFAISYNRINNFQNKFGYNSTNSSNSMRNYFLERMRGTSELVYANQPNEYGGIIDLEGLAYYSWLANNTNDTTYYTYDDGTPVSQKEIVIQRGAQYQWDFSYGTNIEDKIYLGLGLGVVRSRYNEESIYQEENLSTPVDGFRDFRLGQNYQVRGTGINFTLGLIARPIETIRFGLSYQSPTFNAIKESWDADIIANYTSTSPPPDPEQEHQTLILEYKYNMRTPARVNAGLALFAGKNGFITSDIEYVAYNSASLSSRQQDEFDNFGLFDADNETISNAFKNVINLKVGGEFRADIYRLRAGFAYYTHPLNGIDDINRNQTFYTLGGGIKLPEYYIDIALIKTGTNSYYAPYTLNAGNHPTTETKTSTTRFQFTWGTYF